MRRGLRSWSGGIRRLGGSRGVFRKMEEYEVELREITKRFGDVLAVDHVSLQVKRGEFISLLGPSGCGKTTTLRVIAGFEEPTTGEVILGKNMRGVPPYRRPVNTVFQNYALFPHMTVGENVAFGPKRRGVHKSEVPNVVNEALSLVGLEGLYMRYPKQLSGGQQQRVALARALVNKPRVLLLDEPLGALDLKLRKQMQLELKRLQQQIGISFIYVTHDQEEALIMSDRIVVMNSGRIEQIGSGWEIYENPRSKFVADFIGETNLITCQTILKEGRSYLALKSDESSVLTCGPEWGRQGEAMEVSIRPEKIVISREPLRIDHFFSGRVVEKVFLGSMINLSIHFPSGDKLSVKPRDFELASKLEWGENIYFGWNREDVKILRQ